MIYLDTAYIVKCYVAEPGSEKVLALARQSSSLSSCVIGKSEFYGALHRQLRQGILSAEDVQQIHAQFVQDENQGWWHWLSLDDGVVDRVCRCFRELPPSVFLRTADALHLACAKENGFSKAYSNDRHLLEAAAHFDLEAVDVISKSY